MTAGELFIGLATLALAVVTGVMAWHTSRAAEAARDAAGAAAQGAKATCHLAKEAETDRELTWRPYVHVRPLVGENIVTGQLLPPLIVSNIGGGPALGLRVLLWPDHELTKWSRSISIDLGAGRDHTMNDDHFVGMRSIPVYRWFGRDPDPDKRENQGTAVLFWRDVLGWRYRLPVISFPVAAPTPSISISKDRADLRLPDAEWTRSGDGAPDWANDIRIFPTAPGW